MSSSELDRLITMVNEIAANIAPGKDPEAAELAVATHLTKFWPPAMRHKIMGDVQGETNVLNPVALAAIQRLTTDSKGSSLEEVRRGK